MPKIKKYLSEIPELVKEWHPTLNGDLQPETLTHKSGKKVWWACKKQHAYQAIVANKNKGDKSTGCPYCAGKKSTSETCLASLSPNVSKEWHPKKNGELTPDQVTNSSHKKVWWLCVQKHSYQASIAHRTNQHMPTGCPYCAGKKASPDYNLQTEFPEVAAEWHPTKNKSIRPTDVPPRSGKKYWWICKNGHEYQTTVDTRTRKETKRKKPTGCPYCAGRKVNYENNLTAIYPSISEEWHPSRNGNLKPTNVTSGSKRIVWWKCARGDDHEWKAPIHSRNKNNQKVGCPFCANKKVSGDNNLLVVSPDVAAEWHPTKNGTLRPEDVVNGSQKKVWWLCPKEHEYKSSIGQRTGINKTGCNKCSGSSKPEFRLLTELQYVFPNVVSVDRSTGKDIDIMLHDIGVGIEHDGSYWHKQKDASDRNKNEVLKKKRLTLVRVRHHPLKKISKYDVIYKSKYLKKSHIDKLLVVLDKISNGRYREQINLYQKQESFLNNSLYEKYLTYFPSPIPERSLLSTHPKLVANWDYNRNLIGPEHYTPGVDTKVWWICRNEHPSYSASIGQRVRVNSGCPRCANKIPTETNNVLAANPIIAAEWHPTKNKRGPEFYTRASGQQVWWLCAKGHEWKSAIDKRTISNYGCPYCSGSRVHADNCLENLCPEIAQEWHPSKNGARTPKDFMRGSSKKVWWQCSKRHEYQAQIASRTKENGTGCPYCAHKLPSPKYNLKTKHPNVAAEWHPTKNGKLKPTEVLPGTGKKIWWVCKRNHEYEASCLHRSHGTGCPYCSNQKIAPDNN